jgi:GTP cyclohydrolase I
MPTIDEAQDPDLRRALAVRTRAISDAQMREFEGMMAKIFTAYGLDLNTPGTETTPRRFLRALLDSTDGYDGDPKLIQTFHSECHGDPDCALSQIVEGPIPFFSLCEHHALPFYGRVFIGYIAHEELLGLSKLTRLVRLFAKRFTVQERLGRQIAEGMEAMLKPHGVAVYLDAHHLCTQMRGVREIAPLTRTTFWRGEYADKPALRSEFLAVCGARG